MVRTTALRILVYSKAVENMLLYQYRQIHTNEMRAKKKLSGRQFNWIKKLFNIRFSNHSTANGPKQRSKEIFELVNRSVFDGRGKPVCNLYIISQKVTSVYTHIPIIKLTENKWLLLRKDTKGTKKDQRIWIRDRWNVLLEINYILFL